MYWRILLLTALHWGSYAFSQPFKHSSNSHQEPFQVQINPNVELLGLVYFLGYEGPQSETKGPDPDALVARYSYALQVYQAYKPFASSKPLAIALKLAEHLWLDYLLTLLLQVDNFPNAQLKNSLPKRDYDRFSSRRDSLEARENASAFLQALNQFYREVHFETYLQNHTLHYENAIWQVRAGLPKRSLQAAMEKFYQNHFDQYLLIPSLLIPPGMGFGLTYTQGQISYSCHVFGAFRAPNVADGKHVDMGFADEKHLRELSTHEFGHPFVNPVIDRMPDSLLTATQTLFEPIQSIMADQGYPTWKICLYEHFVRAGEIVIAQNLGHAAEATQLLKHYQEDRHFSYLPLLVEELQRYQSNPSLGYRQAVQKALLRLKSEALKR